MVAVMHSVQGSVVMICRLFTIFRGIKALLRIDLTDNGAVDPYVWCGNCFDDRVPSSSYAQACGVLEDVDCVTFAPILRMIRILSWLA